MMVFFLSYLIMYSRNTTKDLKKAINESDKMSMILIYLQITLIINSFNF